MKGTAEVEGVEVSGSSSSSSGCGITSRTGFALKMFQKKTVT